MSRLLTPLAILLFSSIAFTQQDTTVTQQPQPQVQQQPAEQPSPADTDTDNPKKKKSNKVKRKIDEAIPDCINLIFYKGCRSSTARQDDAQERADQQRAEAADRCKQLTAARPKTPPKPVAASQAQIGESSSRTNIDLGQPYCTADTVLAAEHDVDVGDFSVRDKNYRGAEMRYRSALEQLPDDPIATLHLARLLEKLGRNSEALAFYQNFMLWSPTGKEAEEAQNAIKRLQPKA